jgi:hypothetical protein
VTSNVNGSLGGFQPNSSPAGQFRGMIGLHRNVKDARSLGGRETAPPDKWSGKSPPVVLIVENDEPIVTNFRDLNGRKFPQGNLTKETR